MKVNSENIVKPKVVSIETFETKALPETRINSGFLGEIFKSIQKILYFSNKKITETLHLSTFPHLLINSERGIRTLDTAGMNRVL